MPKSEKFTIQEVYSTREEAEDAISDSEYERVVEHNKGL